MIPTEAILGAEIARVSNIVMGVWGGSDLSRLSFSAIMIFQKYASQISLLSACSKSAHVCIRRRCRIFVFTFFSRNMFSSVSGLKSDGYHMSLHCSEVHYLCTQARLRSNDFCRYLYGPSKSFACIAYMHFSVNVVL